MEGTVSYSTDEKRPYQEYLEFEFDIPAIIEYTTAKQKCMLCGLSCFPLYGWLAAPFLLYYSYGVHDNARDEAVVRNLRVTREEIIYTVGKHKAGFRCDCSDVGTITKTVPVDRLQDVLLKEPAGGCIVREILTRAEVQTAANGGMAPTMNSPTGERAELSLVGLKQPHKFRDLVLGLKKNHDVDFRAFVCDGIVLNGEPMGAAVLSESLRGERPLGVMGVIGGSHNKAVDAKLAVLAEEQVSLLKSIDNSLKVIAAKSSM